MLLLCSQIHGNTSRGHKSKTEAVYQAKKSASTLAKGKQWKYLGLREQSRRREEALGVDRRQVRPRRAGAQRRAGARLRPADSRNKRAASGEEEAVPRTAAHRHRPADRRDAFRVQRNLLHQRLQGSPESHTWRKSFASETCSH